MLTGEIQFTFKDGRTAVLRSPREEEAEEILKFFQLAASETDFLLVTGEEAAQITPEQEKSFIKNIVASPNTAMFICFVGGEIAGNCQITFKTNAKERHRAEFAIALVSKFWNLGIGTRMFSELTSVAKSRDGVTMAELEFLEGNTRARALYEKSGFRITSVFPDKYKSKDGRLLNAYLMIKKL